MSPRVAIVLKGYPRLSETFIAQEILALEQRGFEFCILSLRHPYDPAIHPIHEQIRAPVIYLPEYVHDDFARVGSALAALWLRRGFWKALAQLLPDWVRDRSRNRLRRFAQAAVLAAEAPASITHYYTHFMHTPASVSYYASLMSACSWSISAHAKDIWTLPRWELRKKMESADWVVTCTGANEDYLRQLDPGGHKVALLYHGLDFERFDANPAPASARDGSGAGEPVRLLSVGRAVDKKGYDDLLEALAVLPAALHWRLLHIGRGELLEQLQRQAAALGIEARIQWLGGQPQDEVLRHYRAADLFVLPCRISADGDRDGLPNVLMEAQSQRLACLSTRVSGVPELIEHGDTGWLIEPRNSAALADALQLLITDPGLRQRLGQAGCERVRERFSMRAGIDLLVERLRCSLAREQAR